MKIKSIRIENFRSFLDETFQLNRYTSFVGPNGVGKSSILAALNIFFREQSSTSTDVIKLNDEDYFNKNTSNPIRITVTFDDLSENAKNELAAYVRQNELVVTVEAEFDTDLGYGQTKYYGQRMGISEFREFFDAEKLGKKSADLNSIFDRLRERFPDLPNIRSKDDKIAALHEFESTHQESCVLIASEDNFYGINSTGKLSSFVQWVFVPAVKDASEEGQESKNTAFGKLMARAVRSRVNFEDKLSQLKSSTLTSYRELLQQNQESLNALSDALQRRLQFWAHPDVRVGMEWLTDANKAVTLQQPVAGIKTGEGGFLGSLNRMGHGLQRSYLLALLQELASSDLPNSPTLILGCEEPELYQHPPQARYLADVLSELSNGNNQILVTTHSPLFVNGSGFENTRLVRRTNNHIGSNVCGLTYQNLCSRIRASLGDTPKQNEGLIAKIHQTLQPGLAEMFFASIPILVEGLEDISYITTELHLSGLWTEFRRTGCHLISTNGKSNLIQPLAIACELNMPFFVVFDADSNITREDQRIKHERENLALIRLLSATCQPFPNDNVWGDNYVIWRTNISDTIKADFIEADYIRLTEAARLDYSQEGGLEKNGLFIADWVSAARKENLASCSLEKLCKQIITYANTVY